MPRVANKLLSVGLVLACALTQPAAGQQHDHDGHKHGTHPDEQLPRHGPSTPRPRIVIPELEHNFGEVWYGSEVQHIFKVHNEGDAPLQMISVKPSCGCTVAEFDKSIPAGGVGEIKATLSSSKLSKGYFRKEVKVTSNDPERRKMALTITGRIKHFVDVEPRSINFKEIKPHEELTRKFEITNLSDVPLQLTIERAHDDIFNAELREVEIGHKYQLVVETMPPYSAGRHRGTFTLLTNVPQQPKVLVAVTANALARLTLKPQRELIVRRPQPQVTTHPFQLINYGNTPIDILEASTDDARIKVDTRPMATGEGHDITITLPANFRTNPIGQAVTLKTSDPNTPIVTIPIRSTSRKLNAAEKLVGKPAPQVAFETAQGNRIDTSQLDGPLVLFFHTSWNPIANASLALLEPLHKDFKDRGVRFVVINMDQRPHASGTGSSSGSKRLFTREESTGKIVQTGITFDHHFDPQQAIGSSRFNVQIFPAVFVIDSTGTIMQYHGGQIWENRSRPDAFTVGDLRVAIEKCLRSGE